MESRNTHYHKIFTALFIAEVFFNQIYADNFAAVDMKLDNRLLISRSDVSHPVKLRSALFKKSEEEQSSSITDDQLAATDAIIQPNPIILNYHNGPILHGVNDTISLYVIFYGSFKSSQMKILRKFFQSFGFPNHHIRVPTVAKWWEITRGFKSKDGATVARFLHLAKEIHDHRYSLGKNLNDSGIETLVVNSLKHFPTDPEGIYLVLTAHDVLVPGFCVQSCGEHFYTNRPTATKGKRLLYAWIGNAITQCPSFCDWPYAPPPFPISGPFGKPLIAPNGDVGIDGMVISIADSISSIATDPFGTGYYEGVPGDYLEAAGACQGAFGPNSFPGYPGDLLIDHKTHASFNVYGAQNTEFLVPMLWNPSTETCEWQS
ncbi:hypothetical protein O6H91_02G078700 [Diphasiastrum complanatum]|uniref:Uncharacterized protein n=1 Tax=Diphasiastrum complanatum TaxID=34168 RepID=A0ACC2EH96_DIPCM|nr:hypothetical protein O6H91_02G078700 [Diphasiastrum complanatum]